MKVTGDPIQGRRNMGSSLCEKLFFVQGGQDNHMEVIGDCFVFHIERHDWRKVKLIQKRSSRDLFGANPALTQSTVGAISEHDSYKLPLAFHSMNTIDRPEKNKVQIYLFGGVNPMNKAQNTLQSLVLNKQTLECKVKALTDYSGKAPLPRSHHSALLISQDRYLLIYGGRNDDLFGKIPGAKTDMCLNDIILFNIRIRQWETLEQFGFNPEARWSAGLAYDPVEEKLLLFGGSNAKGFCANNMMILEMKPEKIDLLF